MTGPTSLPATWPRADLDRIARLRALAAALPGGAFAETVVEAPFGPTWGLVSDFERSVPAADVDVARLRIVRRSGDPGRHERLRIASRQSARVLWLPAVLDAEVSPGWCLMVSRPQVYVVGMAAEPDGDRTRLAFMEAVAPAGPRWLRAMALPALAVSRWRHRRHVPGDVEGMRRFVLDHLDEAT
jgi:hypothetical protein